MERVITYSFGEDFIKNIAEYILTNFSKGDYDLSQLAIVFGGKRPSLFLKRELANKLNRSYFSPSFFSIDEFIEYLVNKKEGIRRISELDACYFIYEIVKSCSPELLPGKERFSSFLPWAKEIVAFIEQLDLEGIADEDLKNVKENAEIGYEVPASINQLLQQIVFIRRKFHDHLLKKKLYSRGFFYLTASKLISELDTEEFDNILFCHLFSLHKTEKKIVKHLFDIGKAILFFQRNEREWSQLNKLAAYLNCRIEPKTYHRPKYNLSVYSGFDTQSQVGAVREIFKDIKKPQRSVIVLPEPENVVPLLSEIIAEVEEFNVSMGYPLKRSTLYNLFTAIIQAQTAKREDTYYSRNYLKVISHPLMKNLSIKYEPAVTRILVHKIEELLSGMIESSQAGSLFVSLEDIKNCKELYVEIGDYLAGLQVKTTEADIILLFEQVHWYGFGIWEKIKSFSDFSGALKEFLDMLVKNSFLETYPLNLKIINRLYDLAEGYANFTFKSLTFNKQDIFKIFDDSLRNERISFSGTPLKGLQILGLFETRSLSFENVIVMDANESVIPKLRIYEPLIPRSVMISLGLNRLEEEEEIQRYQFMRLISSAKNVFLVYNDNPQKQRSRFIEEIIWEKEKESSALGVLPSIRADFRVEVLPKQGRLEKSEQVKEFLNNFIFSASSINTYLNCPLQFYYQYVLGLRQKDDLLDEPQGKEIGIFIHALLEDRFTQFLRKRPQLSAGFEKDFFKYFEQSFAQEFTRRIKSDAFMLQVIMEHRLKKFLRNEIKRQSEIKEIISLEQFLKKSIKLSTKRIPFECRVDRIDWLEDDSILVIDYKTGSTDETPRGIKSLEKMEYELKSIRKTIRSFQLPLYLQILKEDYKHKRIKAAVYNFKKVEFDYFPKPKEENDLDRIMEICLKALEFVIAEIQDLKTPFAATQDTQRNCDYCSFFYLCR